MMPGSVGLINNNTNINVNAGAGSVVNIEVINANAFGPSLYPSGPIDMFASESPYSFPALLPSFLGAPKVDLLPRPGLGRTANALPPSTAGTSEPGPAPASNTPASNTPAEPPHKEHGCAGTEHHHKPHRHHHGD